MSWSLTPPARSSVPERPAPAVGLEAVRRRSRRDETCRARSRCDDVRVRLSYKGPRARARVCGVARDTQPADRNAPRARLGRVGAGKRDQGLRASSRFAETQARRAKTTSARRQGAGTAGRPSLTAVRPTSLKRCRCVSWRRISGRSAASLLPASGSELGSRAVKAGRSTNSSQAVEAVRAHVEAVAHPLPPRLSGLARWHYSATTSTHISSPVGKAAVEAATPVVYHVSRGATIKDGS
jgi:hypothetical protein